MSFDNNLKNEGGKNRTIQPWFPTHSANEIVIKIEIIYFRKIYLAEVKF